jgi:hypothetical protein
VTHIFINHHHPDHTVNIALFPNAEVVDFWGMDEGDLWRDHGDGHEIDPGIKVLRTLGHTAQAEQDLSRLVQHAQGHATSMSVNTTVKPVRFSVESFEVFSLSCCLPSGSRPSW